MQPVLRVRWQLRYTRCNLKCPYCIAAWSARAVEFDPSLFDTTIDALLGQSCRLVVRLGVEGEIFLSKKIRDGVARLSLDPKVEGVSFSTNLCASWNEIESFLDRTDTSRLGVGATLHDSQIDDLEEFFRKVEAIHRRGVLVFVGFVAIPERVESIPRYKRRLDAMGVPFILNEFSGRANRLSYPRDYTERERAVLEENFFSRHYYEMLVERRSPKGRPCTAGNSYVYIGADGNLFPCGMDRNPEWTGAQKIAWRVNKKIAIGMRRSAEEGHRLGRVGECQLGHVSGTRACPHRTCACGNEVQAMAEVSEMYHRTRAMRVIYPKASAAEYEAKYPNLRPIEGDDRPC